MTEKPDSAEKPNNKPKPSSSSAKTPVASTGDSYELSGDFRGAVVNIKSTIVSSAEVKDLENLPPEPGEPPFQGLQYFDEEDADRFFGREALTARIVGRLTSSSFLTVIGASGSGKSSVVRAGVIPALRRGERLADGSLPPTDSGQWDIRILTPGAHPLDALAASLTRDAESVTAASTARNDLAQDVNALCLISRRVLAQSSKKRLLLVIDQFEEIFTQCRQDDERKSFIENILCAIDPANPQPVSILLTLRADFYAQLAFEDRLREMVSQNQEFIGAMSREELTRAILQPAALANWKVQEGLVEVILDDLGTEPGALPLLSHALLETWKRRRARVMTLSGYTASGGVRGAIAQTAETVFRQRLSREQQPIARMIFIKLAEMNQDSPDTRRRATFSELITRATDTRTIDAVLNILTDARLITTGVIEPSDTRVVEVAHEALIREWPTLRDWLNQNREGLILHRQLTEDTNDWLKLGRDSGSLYRGVRLKQMLDWVKSNTDLISLSEQEFLDASEKVARKEANQTLTLRQTRWLTAGLAVIVIVIILGINGAFARHVMPEGIFNIAVAEFGEMDSAGEIYVTETSKLLSEWTVNDLREALGADASNLVIWPDQGNIFARTRVPLVTAATAEQTAKDLNADLLLYGYVNTRTDPAQLILSFYVAPQDKYKFEDIQGSTQIGMPIRVINLEDPGISVKNQLQKQSAAVAWVAMGLAQEQLGQAEDALADYQKADQALPESDFIKFFLGRAYLFVAEFQPEQQEQFWQKAEDAFLESIRISGQFAKARLGLGSVYIKRSSELLNAAMSSGGVVDPQAAQFAEQGIEAYLKVLDTNLYDHPSGTPDQELARLALGNAYRQKGATLLHQGDASSALEAFDEAIKYLENVRPQFESSLPEHESYRRYLAQTYEFLGTAYQWQGTALETAQSYEEAKTAYQNSIDAFDQCISQASLTDDLVIQKDIVGQYCQPKREEVQQIYNELTAGN